MQSLGYLSKCLYNVLSWTLGGAINGTMSVSSDNPADLLIICDMIDGVYMCILILGVHVESVNEATSNAS